jgi:hypothetical protein
VPRQTHEQHARNDAVQFDYRSINRVPTALGIERKACVVGGMLALIRFHLGGGLLESAAYFVVYWAVIFALSQWEPRLFRMLRSLCRQKRFYSASKFVSD